MYDATRTPPDAIVVPLADAAKQLGISPDAARKRLERGTLQGHKLGGRWFVYLEPDAAVDAILTNISDLADAVTTPVDATMDVTLERVDATWTPPDATATVAPLAEIITDLNRQNAQLSRENQELAVAAALWQERARFLSEQLQALEAGPIAPPVAGDVHEHAPQDAPSSHLQGEVHQETIQVPPRDDLPEPTPETDERPWWRRLVDRF